MLAVVTSTIVVVWFPHFGLVQDKNNAELGIQDNEPLNMSLLAIESYVLTVIGWTTPQNQIKDLLERKDFNEWETFRDSLVSRWSNGSVVVGGFPLKNFVVDQSVFSVV